MKFHYLLTFGFALSVNVCKSQSSNISPTQWQADIDFLVEKMSRTIPEFYEHVDKPLFDACVSLLKQNIDGKSTNQMVVALQEILNMVNDEGCAIYPFQKHLNFKVLPIKTYWFEDGLYILDAKASHQHLIGKQINSINNKSIDEVYSKLRNNLNADNESYRKHSFVLYSLIPNWLEGNDLSVGKDEILLGFENAEAETIKAESVEEYIKRNRGLVGHKQLVTSATRHDGENYWMEFVPETKTLVIQFIQIRDAKDGVSIKSFFKEVAKRINDPEIEKVVIDNRFGGGGNGFKLKPFTDMLKDNKKINQKGKLFVLTSRTTRGTVMELTSILELNTKITIIGEPTGEGPNLVGDGKAITLPNSQIRVNLTNKFWPTSWDEDMRTSLEPHINIAYSYSDYKSKIDPWMNAVVAYKSPKPKGIIPENLAKGLEGSYTINGRKVEIYHVDGVLMLTMKRKTNSFFEINTELYLNTPGILSTDIIDVFVNYATVSEKQISLTSIDWKGLKLEVED